MAEPNDESERLYPKLSPEEKHRALMALKVALHNGQIDPKTAAFQDLDPQPPASLPQSAPPPNLPPPSLGKERADPSARLYPKLSEDEMARSLAMLRRSLVNGAIRPETAQFGLLPGANQFEEIPQASAERAPNDAGDPTRPPKESGPPAPLDLGPKPETPKPAGVNLTTIAQPTVLEAIEDQLRQLASGVLHVVMYRRGTPVTSQFPAVENGLQIAFHRDPFGNVYAYRPDLTTKYAMTSAAAKNKLNDVSGVIGISGADQFELISEASEGTEPNDAGDPTQESVPPLPEPPTKTGATYSGIRRPP